jgi:hypothetical protein
MSLQLSLPRAEEIAHVFVDASNVNVQPHEIPALDAIARNGFSRFASALVVGSTDGPSPKPAIWSSLNYKVVWSQRHGQPEAAYNVDSAIVSAMLLDICIHSDASNRVIVLLSGDGNDNDGMPSFRDAVQQALSKGWTVKLVCYKPNDVYIALQQAFSQQMQIQIITREQIAHAAKGCVPVAAAAPKAPAVGGKSRSRTPSPPALSQQLPCSFFASGCCKNGDACKFVHAACRHAPPATGPVLLLPKPYRPPPSNQCEHHQQAPLQLAHNKGGAADATMTRLAAFLDRLELGHGRTMTMTL